MSLTGIAVRALLAYVFLLVIARVSGKRTLRQLTPVDLTASLILGDLVDDLVWAEVPAAQFIVAAGMLLTVAVATTLAAAASSRFNRFIFGCPAGVICDGALVESGAKGERLNEAEVMALLREQGIDDMREVRAGTLEAHGTLGVIRRRWAEDAQKRDVARVRLLREKAKK